MDDCILKIKRSEDKNSHLLNQIFKLNQEQIDLIKKENELRDELHHLKRYYSKKQDELQHHIKKLIKENQQLKETFGKDINMHNSRDDISLKLLKTHKVNEEIYKTTIQKLQENNKELLDEVLNLKEELALNLCNEKRDLID